MRLITMTSLAAALLLAATAVADVPPSADLPVIFNGKDLTGWKVVGGPYWKVVDGAIVGENDTEKKGSMLYTEQSYDDAIIEGEVRFTGEIDSGIMVRKDAAGKKDIQMQIGVSRSLKKDMTGAFYIGKYPEAGWAPKVATLWKNDDWNKIRFQAKGDTYTVWINGEQVSNYVDANYPKAAPIGLQVHGGVKMKVEYRNISVGEIK